MRWVSTVYGSVCPVKVSSRLHTVRLATSPGTSSTTPAYTRTASPPPASSWKLSKWRERPRMAAVRHPPTAATTHVQLLRVE